MKTVQQPYPELANKIGISEIYLKREDENKYGSHKCRSIPLMIKRYFKEGVNNFVISSSGNAALSAIGAVQDHNKNNDVPVELKIFVGKNIDPLKLKKLISSIEDPKIKLEQVDNPKQMAFQMEKNGEAKFLRQSTDDTALLGYADLATELSKIPDLQAVFVPTSSGTTAQALGEHFASMNLNIQIHIVQTDFCHPMSQEFDKDFVSSEKSLAGAIVDKVAHRKNKVVEVIKNSHGFGWIVNDAQIKEAKRMVKENTKIDISPNSALAIAGLQKAVANNWQWTGPVVCLITGR